MNSLYACQKKYQDLKIKLTISQRGFHIKISKISVVDNKICQKMNFLNEKHQFKATYYLKSVFYREKIENCRFFVFIAVLLASNEVH